MNIHSITMYIKTDEGIIEVSPFAWDAEVLRGVVAACSWHPYSEAHAKLVEACFRDLHLIESEALDNPPLEDHETEYIALAEAEMDAASDMLTEVLMKTAEGMMKAYR